jgi:hypothetical protein
MLERENAALREALKIIAVYGGTAGDDGLRCNGGWCAEQARAALAAKEAKP